MHRECLGGQGRGGERGVGGGGTPDTAGTNHPGINY